MENVFWGVIKMETVCEINRCNGCMACISVCPCKCITIKDSLYSYNAIVDKTVCVNCKLCENVCPNIKSLKKIKPYKWKQGWADYDIRKDSASGGIASAIIKNFILSGGYVASCLFRNGQFLFEITNDLDVAKQFAGSKYVKSNPEGIYEKIRERLKTHKVLFIGLPCQVAAVKNYVKKQDNLYTIDLICHGTPSPKVLQYYLKEHKIELNKVSDIRFRNHNSFQLVSDYKIFNPEGVDDYLLSFLSTSIYTENCYSCNYASFERVSDLTLGDSWGTEYSSEIENGISLVLVQTNKGESLIGMKNAFLVDVDIENAIKANSQLREPAKRSTSRNVFLNAVVNEKSFRLATLRVFPVIILKRWIKRILFKLNLYRPGGGYRLMLRIDNTLK